MKKKLVLLSQSIGLLSILWICYFLVTVFFKSKQEAGDYFPPKSAQIAICLNGEDIFNKAAFTALIDSKDVEVSNLLRRLFANRKKDDGSGLKLIGVNLFSYIHFFTDEFHEKTLSGFIFNVDNTALWDENSDNYFGNHSFAQRTENSGIILTSNLLTKQELQAYFQQQSFTTDYEDAREFDHSLQLRYACKNSIEKTLQNLKSNLSIKEKAIHTEGTLLFGKNVEITPLSYSLKPNHFHVDSRIIPREWNDTIRAWAKKYITEIPSIKALSLNYEGVEIQTTDNGVLPLPNMELILEFGQPFSIQNFINRTEIMGEIDIQLKTNYFKIGPKVYYLQQLSPSTIYIGTVKEPVIQSREINAVISLEGSPHYLTEVKGSRFMMTLLNMNSVFSQSKEFFQDIESIKGSLRQQGNQPLRYNAIVQFKEGENAMNELLKVILTNAQSAN